MSTPTPDQTPAPPPGLPPELEALRDKLAAVLGTDAVWELKGKLPAFRLPAKAIVSACKTLRQAGFDYLLFVTAVDYPSENRFEIVYVAGQYNGPDQIALVTDIPRDNPVVESVSQVWDTAEWHEREIFDLFGIRFENHRDLRRILLDDTWEGYPLRKDYVDKVHNVVKRPY